MRSFYWMSVVLTAGAALSSAFPMLAQDAPPAGGGGQGRQRGGFGGGQMVQGTVTAATADKVTIKTDAGDTYTVTAGDNTRVTRDRQQITLKDIKAGDSVTAMGAVDASAKTVTAMMVMDVDAATVKKAKEDMGKTYITGKITAIDADNLKITVMRTDNVSQDITVDEGTSFQKGARGITVPSVGGMGGMGMGGGRGAGGMGGGGGMGRGAGQAGAGAPAVESITLADIKVGDGVVATGALKGGVFVPAKMGVTEPMAAGAGRRPRPAAGDGATPPPPPPQ